MRLPTASIASATSAFSPTVTEPRSSCAAARSSARPRRRHPGAAPAPSQRIALRGRPLTTMPGPVRSAAASCASPVFCNPDSCLLPILRETFDATPHEPNDGECRDHQRLQRVRRKRVGEPLRCDLIPAVSPSARPLHRRRIALFRTPIQSPGHRDRAAFPARASPVQSSSLNNPHRRSPTTRGFFQSGFNEVLPVRSVTRLVAHRPHRSLQIPKSEGF